MKERLVDRQLNPLLTTLPAKFAQIHDYQAEAIYQIVEAFLDDNEQVVVVEAPTGSGKTLIAECVRRLLKVRACYVCHNRDLQQQFATDFPYSRVLWGRDNYDPNHPVCLLNPCDCEYQRAKLAAVYSPVPVLNSAYWLNEVRAGRGSRFARTGMVVFDEADTLQNVMMDQVEIYVGEWTQKRYHIAPPSKLTVEGAYVEWAERTIERLLPVIEKQPNMQDPVAVKEYRRIVGLHGNVVAMLDDLKNGLPWVYTGGAGSQKRKGDAISFKPVKVDRFGTERIWGHDKRFLLMSASIISPGHELASLGWTGPYKYVTVESTFHPRNRQVVTKGVASMTRKGETDAGYARLLDELRSTFHRHEGQRGVIHSVSYSLTNRLVRDLRDTGRPILSYWNGRDRADVLARYTQVPNAVLIAPSVDRGIDLPDDLCRWQVIVKIPYLNLGDKQVEQRLYKTPDGKLWYNVHVARTIMQMVGRGVRHQNDTCVTYILDSTWQGWYKAWGHLLPRWFKKAIRPE